MARKVVDARENDRRVNTHVRFEGNDRFTRMDRAVEIVRREGSPNAHVVEPRGRSAFLRTNPDNRQTNNLDYLAED